MRKVHLQAAIHFEGTSIDLIEATWLQKTTYTYIYFFICPLLLLSVGGTGLGLSVSYFIITENHGGSLSVEAVPEGGTRFIICLPLERRLGSDADDGAVFADAH